MEAALALSPITATIWRAPAATLRSTCSWTSSRAPMLDIGPSLVAGSRGSPIFQAAIFCAIAVSKAWRTAFTTMKRLPAMQLCPPFTILAVAATFAAATTSASSRTR